MKENNMQICSKKKNYIIYTIGYILSYTMASLNHHYFAGIILMILALFLYMQSFHDTKNLVDMKGIFSLSWISGQGLACLQLSNLQSDWNSKTWICFGVAYLCFCLGYDRLWAKKGVNLEESCADLKKLEKNSIVAKRIFICILVLAIASIICFGLEAVIVGFIPIFSKLPHAYSYFHVSGIHYITISCILIPALTVIYMKTKSKNKNSSLVILGVCNVIAVLIPILCVSRFQLLFAVMFAVVVYIVTYKNIGIKTVVVLFLVLIPIYVLLTIARNHNISYLNGIFEMKNAKMPIFVTQPYMYIANNYDNFNCLVNQLPEFSGGIRMLFPFFALTGLKFVFPSVVQLPNFVTKAELTTFTIFYDSYYDFGIIGVMIFALVLGFVSKKVTEVMLKSHNAISHLLYGQIVIYLGLSFFTTWFSNPTTWFWLVLTAIMYVYVGYPNRKRNN